MKHHLDQNHRFEIKQIIPLILRAVLFPFLLAFENGSTPNKLKKKKLFDSVVCRNED